MHYGCFSLTLLCLATAACAGGESRAAEARGPLHEALTAPCTVVQAALPLPQEARETSGLAASARDPELFWTHNDAGNAPELYGVNSSGALVQRVRVTGAALKDWEDVESAPCGDDACLFIGDIGDNDGDRDHIVIYRVPEPAAGVSESARVEALHARFPDGARDAESLFTGPGGELYVVTKGRSGPIALYRYPAPLQPGVTVTLERVRELAAPPTDERDRVTGATSSPDRRWVAIRTYRTLRFYRLEQLIGTGGVQPLEQDLSSLAETQGESVVLANDGSVWLSSEAESGGRPTLARLRCTLPQ